MILGVGGAAAAALALLGVFAATSKPKEFCLFFSSSLQIQKVVMALGDYMGASCHACIGGTNVRAEVQKLQMEAPHIIVGTPGRVFDMLNRRYLCKCLCWGSEWPLKVEKESSTKMGLHFQTCWRFQDLWCFAWILHLCGLKNRFKNLVKAVQV